MHDDQPPPHEQPSTDYHVPQARQATKQKNPMGFLILLVSFVVNATDYFQQGFRWPAVVSLDPRWIYLGLLLSTCVLNPWWPPLIHQRWMAIVVYLGIVGTSMFALVDLRNALICTALTAANHLWIYWIIHPRKETAALQTSSNQANTATSRILLGSDDNPR